MIQVGTTSLTFSRGRGTFQCPSCRSLREFRAKYARSYVTVYFIPLIPYGPPRDFVVCATCKQEFEPSVLTRKPADERRDERENRLQMLQALLILMIADGTVAEAEIAAVQQFAVRELEIDLNRAVLAEQLRLLRGRGRSFAQAVEPFAGRLNEAERQLFGTWSFLVASATGQLADPQCRQLEQLPDLLQVPVSVFRRWVSDAARRG